MLSGSRGAYAMARPLRYLWAPESLQGTKAPRHQTMWSWNSQHWNHLCTGWGPHWFITIMTIAGWCNSHLEKLWVLQWEELSHVVWKIKNVWNHQPDSVWYLWLYLDGLINQQTSLGGHHPVASSSPKLKMRHWNLRIPGMPIKTARSLVLVKWSTDELRHSSLKATTLDLNNV